MDNKKKAGMIGLVGAMAYINSNNGRLVPKQPTKHIQVTKNGKRIVTYKYE